MIKPENTQSLASAEVAIVGAGPIGLEMAAALKGAGVDYLHLEARQIGYTITWWPRETHFFSTTERIEIAGIPLQNTSQQRATGEEYLAYLRSVVEQLDLQVNTYETVIDIQRQEGGFVLRTKTHTGERNYSCHKLILAIGDMHAPNMLGIPGEDLPHVSHYFEDPHKYFRKKLLIVGGRNSAVEAALRCWRVGSQVSISYRRATFDTETVKDQILPDVLTQIEFGNIGFYPETIPVEITLEKVILAKVRGSEREGECIELPVDFVLLNTGFVQNPRLFEMAGVNLVGEHRAPAFNPETMETNVPGLFLAGTTAAGTQKRYRLFIENCHVHVGKVLYALTGRWPEKLGTIPERQYEPPFEHIQAN
ncbi:MAG: NAD(P)-binding domain-containing protein [Anaerolineales bacterium]|nr:NAD(P)-binding domain-containing protein [Anaerolineales bacterium]